MRIPFGTITVAALAMPCAAVDVTVTPGFDFTNVVVRVSGALGAQVSLVDSANSPVASGASLAPASAYAYDVRLDGSSIASGAFATGSEETPMTNEWTMSPMVTGEFGAEHAGRMYPDRYVMELRVPVKNIYPLKDGEVWKVNICRSRVFRDEFAHPEEHFSIGGVGFLATTAYHPFIIGTKKGD